MNEEQINSIVAQINERYPPDQYGTLKSYTAEEWLSKEGTRCEGALIIEEHFLFGALNFHHGADAFNKADKFLHDISPEGMHWELEHPWSIAFYK
jgi:hypothetical protein